MANRWRDMAVQLYTLRPMNFDFGLLIFDPRFHGDMTFDFRPAALVSRL